MINAADYGYPQRRRRIFIFAFRKNTKFYKNISKVIKENDDAISEFIRGMAPFSNTMLNESVSNLEKINLSSFKTVEDLSNELFVKKGFKKTGVMLSGKVFMTDYVPKARKEKTIGDLLINNVKDEELYLSREKIEKFEELKKGFHEIKTSRTGYHLSLIHI